MSQKKETEGVEYNGLTSPLLANDAENPDNQSTQLARNGADWLQVSEPSCACWLAPSLTFSLTIPPLIDQTTAALLALQLGWGLWLMGANFSTLGLGSGLVILLLLGSLTAYSGYLFSRLYLLVPGTVIFGDIGFKAAGEFGRNSVFFIIYLLDGSRCVILHLAASQSLRHMFPREDSPPLWQCGLLVLVASLVLVQVRSLADLSIVFLAGTSSQLVAIAIVLYELVSNPDPNAKHSFQSISWDNLVQTAVSIGAIVFAFGGQFAFVEVQASMSKPQDFSKAVNLCTLLMGLLYLLVGAVGWWSKGDTIGGILIFSLGESPLVRFASGCILIQAISQYLINLNVWIHNLLTLVSRSLGASEGSIEAQCSQEQCPYRWFYASVFVVAYSYLLSISVPFFSTLVSLITSTCYLICAYALPAYFTLILIGDKIGSLERLFLQSLIPASFIFSALGLYASIVSLANDLSGGGEGGWGSKQSS